MSWQPIPLDTPLASLAGKHIAVLGTNIYGRDSVILVRLRADSDPNTVQLLSFESETRRPFKIKSIFHNNRIPATTTLIDALRTNSQSSLKSAGEVPEIRWGRHALKGWRIRNAFPTRHLNGAHSRKNFYTELVRLGTLLLVGATLLTTIFSPATLLETLPFFKEIYKASSYKPIANKIHGLKDQILSFIQILTFGLIFISRKIIFKGVQYLLLPHPVVVRKYLDSSPGRIILPDETRVTLAETAYWLKQDHPEFQNFTIQKSVSARRRLWFAGYGHGVDQQWQSIPLETPLSKLVGKHIAIAGLSVINSETLTLVSVKKSRHPKKVLLLCMEATERKAIPPKMFKKAIAEHHTLRQALLAFAQVTPQIAQEVPYIDWGRNDLVGLRQQERALYRKYLHELSHLERRYKTVRYVTFFGLPPILLISGLNIYAPYLFSQHIILWLAIAALWIFFSCGREILYSCLRLSSLLETPHVRQKPESIHDFYELISNKFHRTTATDKVLDRLYATASSVPQADLSVSPTGPTPQDRVTQVKAQYAQLHDDIIYRIENSALFDTAVPHTQRFELALLAWNPESEQAERLADELEQAFHQAREHAETLGYSHLPQNAQRTAQRAAKAAEVALTSTNQAERLTAKHHVAELLSSLALYWLPVVDETAPTLIGKPKMIDPAP